MEGWRGSERGGVGSDGDGEQENNKFRLRGNHLI